VLSPVLGNAPQVEQALAQILLNAVDASPQGGEVAIDARREGQQAVIVVRDRGPGIAPEDLPHVFEPFFTRKEPGKGVGLGLAIARSIVESHGGTIEVESDRSVGGTLARVRLPMAAQPASAGKPEPRVGIGGVPEGAPSSRNVA
jgi:signal transduction histidine kinase